MELQSDARPEEVRQAAGMRLKVSLDSTVRQRAAYALRRAARPRARAHPPPLNLFLFPLQDEALAAERRARWTSLPLPERKVVKDLVTATLSSASRLAGLAAAQVISKIGAAEILPDSNTWPELLPGLFSFAESAALPVDARAAALTTLGYLLEELDRHAESPLQQADVDRCLTVVCGSMAAGAPPPIALAAAKAMFNALPFVATNFDDAHSAERDSIMTAVCGASQLPAALPTREVAFQCIERIAELYYDKLSPYMATLAQLTFTAAKGTEENVATGALGFWAEIAETEATRQGEGDAAQPSHGYTKVVLRQLCAALPAIMVAHVKDDFDADAFGPAESAQACLQHTAAACGAAVLPEIMPFVTENFASPDWRKRDAALMCLALVQASLPDEVVRDVNAAALPHVLGRVAGAGKDASDIVRSSAVFCLGEMLEYHVAVAAAAPGGVLSTLPVLCEAVSDAPCVARLAAVALCNLVRAVDEAGLLEAPGDATVFSPQLHVLISRLIARADQPDADDLDLRAECFQAISDLVDYARAADHPILLSLLTDVALARLSASLAAAPAAAADDRARAAATREAMVGMILTILCAVGPLAAPHANRIAGVLLQVIDLARDAASEAWYALGTLATMCLPEGGFAPFADAVHPRLLAGLRATADYATAKACVVFISDVTRNLGAAMPPARYDELMQALVAVLADQGADRALKPPAIEAFAAMGTAVERYLNVILPIIAEAAAVPDPVRRRARGGARARAARRGHDSPPPPPPPTTTTTLRAATTRTS